MVLAGMVGSLAPVYQTSTRSDDFHKVCVEKAACILSLLPTDRQKTKLNQSMASQLLICADCCRHMLSGYFLKFTKPRHLSYRHIDV